jgi:transcriptional regulator with XRE-family HTH domain
MTSRMAEEAKDFREFLDQLRSEPGYWKHFTILQFTAAMARLMKKPPRVSGKELAQLLGVAPSTVSKALSGGENLTIETMAKIAGALDAAVYIHVAKKGTAVHWVEDSAYSYPVVSEARVESSSASSGVVIHVPLPSDGVISKQQVVS